MTGEGFPLWGGHFNLCGSSLARVQPVWKFARIKKKMKSIESCQFTYHIVLKLNGSKNHLFWFSLVEEHLIFAFMFQNVLITIDGSNYHFVSPIVVLLKVCESYHVVWLHLFMYHVARVWFNIAEETLRSISI